MGMEMQWKEMHWNPILPISIAHVVFPAHLQHQTKNLKVMCAKYKYSLSFFGI